MKKLLALTLSLLLIIGLFAGCKETPVEVDNTVVRLAGMKGPTTMGLVGLLDKNEQGTSKNKYDFSLKGAADEIVPLLSKGELDVAAVPANVASVLYNKTEGKISVIALSNLGVLYVVERGESIKSVADLKGKTIYATGKGTTPEYSLRYILEKNNINPDTDVTLEFMGEATEVVAKLSQNEGAIAMLPQPYVTVASQKIADLTTRLDLNAEWEKVGGDSRMVTGVIVARTEFIEEHPVVIKNFLDEYKESIEFVNSDNAAAATLIEKIGIVEKAPIAQKALPFCNIKFLEGAELKSAMEGYLKVLYDSNPAAVGGKLPADEFYYAR